MVPVRVPRQVSSRHALQVALAGNPSVTVNVVDGGPVFHHDQPHVSTLSNQGSIANGESRTFSTGVWLISGDSASVMLSFGGETS